MTDARFDALFWYSDDDELRHETQAQHTERECARRFSFETHDGHFSQHFGQNDDRNVRQVLLSKHLMKLVLMSKCGCPRSFSSTIVNLIWTKTTAQKKPLTVEWLRFSSKHLTAHAVSIKRSLAKRAKLISGASSVEDSSLLSVLIPVRTW